MADVDNMAIQQQLNKLMEERKKTLQETNRVLRQQATIAKEITETLSQASMRDDALRKTNDLKNSLMAASAEAQNFSEQTSDLNAAIEDGFTQQDDGFEGLLSSYGKATKKASVWGSATSGFVSGIGIGFDMLKNGLSGVLSLAGTVAQGIFSIGTAVLSIPFKIFNAFVSEANRMGGNVELWRQFEETRKSFGDFGKDMSKNVLDSFRSMRGELANTGLSVWRVTGFLHEKLQLLREMAEGMGETFHQFGSEIASNAEAMVAYEKGLGQTHESMRALAEITQGTGGTFESTLRTVTNFSTTLGDTFGISQKVIARDVGEMAKDLKTFGSVGVRQMAQLSTFARTLGTDFKKLLGVVDKFDNFEDAADSAARLAQAFGINVDVMGMMNAQDPAERVDQLRKAFFAAGKSIDSLTRQERNYLATQTGIEDQALNAVFALENQGKTYDQIKQSGAVAEKQQISQAEAMKRLSDSIERMVKSGQRQGGFFDRFIMGFKRGLRWSREFWGIMRNIRRSLWATEHAGRRVGRSFAKNFPGVEKFLKGVREFFHPKKFYAMGRKVTRAFTQFFKELGDPSTAQKALGNLLKALRQAFFGMADSQSGAMSKIIEGFKTGFKAVGQVILSAGKIAIEYFAKFIRGLTAWIGGDTSFTDAMSKMFGDGASAGFDMFGKMWDEIVAQLGGATSELGKAFSALFDKVWPIIEKKLEELWDNIPWGKILTSKPGMIIAGIMFGPAFLKAGMSLVGSGIQMMMQKAMANKLAGSLASKAAGQAGQAAVGSFAGKIGPMAARLGPMLLNPWVAVGVAVGAIGIAAYSAFSEIAAYGKELDKQIKNIDKLAKKKKKALDQETAKININKNLLTDLYNTENQHLEHKLDYLTKENSLTADNLRLLKERASVDQTAEIDKMYKEMERLEQRKSEFEWGMGPSDAELNMQIQSLRNQAKKLVGERANMQATYDRQISKVENAPQKEEFNMSQVSMMAEQAKKFSPEEIKKLETQFLEAKEMIDKKGGLRDILRDLMNSFNLGEGLQGSLESFNSFMGQKAIIEVGINSATDLVNRFNTLGEEISSITGKNRKELPIVKGIRQMVKAANDINKELSNIEAGNVQVQLNTLSKALGLSGDGKLSFKKEDFNVNVQIDVRLDPNKLADSVLETKKVMKSTKLS